MVKSHPGLPSIDLPPGFQWRLGRDSDRKQLLHCMQLAFAEAFPEQTSWSHLAQTVEQYFHPISSPVWWIEQSHCEQGDDIQKIGRPLVHEPQIHQAQTHGKLASTATPSSLAACIWICQGIGQATGLPVVYVLALWVSPQYRRQGLGSAAIHAAKEWGTRVGCDAIELQVFGSNQGADMFYRCHGFGVAGTWMQLPLNVPSRDSPT